MSYVYIVQMDIPQHLEAEFNRVYDTEHFPMLSKVPGGALGGALSARTLDGAGHAAILDDLRARLA